jgi:hypothetical protein
MSRSSVLAAAILLAGLVAFLLLVTGPDVMAHLDGSASVEVATAPEPQIDIEDGTWIAYEEPTLRAAVPTEAF